ncbi:MAG TPA: acetate/propionate family kinase [Gaiellaceae bacterium]|nr:acetate/propionate family kinase [Gaiellaceae bacterium]
MRVLVVNAGSSSLKLSVLDEHDRLVLSETVASAGGRPDEEAVRAAVRRGGPVDAAGHRVVHGGTEFLEPAVVDEAVLRRLHALADLAPLHQPKSLAALELVTRLLPGVPAVASFDTAFHARMPEAASTYALPAEWRKRFALRRFGFHGLSHAYASRRAAELAGVPADGFRVVTCHLGAGASLAAVESGRSVDTTMGFTPLEGLVMATRAGTVDPGLVLWLEEHVGMPPSELASTLEHRSGLYGLAGSADMKAVLEAEAAGDEDAALAVAVYLHRLRGGIAAMAAALGGLDALVFTGGVGERSAPVRERAAAGLGFLGVELDAAANAAPRLDAEVGAAGAEVRTFVVEAREDLQIARDVRAALR